MSIFIGEYFNTNFINLANEKIKMKGFAFYIRNSSAFIECYQTENEVPSKMTESERNYLSEEENCTRDRFLIKIWISWWGGILRVPFSGIYDAFK